MMCLRPMVRSLSASFSLVTDDRVIEISERHDRIDRLGERHLHRSAHLAAVHVGGHHRAEGADVVEVVGTSRRSDRARLFVVLGQLLRFLLHADGLVGLLVLVVEDGALLHVDRERRRHPT